MKKYSVVFDKNGVQFSLCTHAKTQAVAHNKAVKRARQMTKDKTITASDITATIYEGFYLGRRFIQIFQD